jgi:hypothetical protein
MCSCAKKLDHRDRLQAAKQASRIPGVCWTTHSSVVFVPASQADPYRSPGKSRKHLAAALASHWGWLGSWASLSRAGRGRTHRRCRVHRLGLHGGGHVGVRALIRRATSFVISGSCCLIHYSFMKHHTCGCAIVSTQSTNHWHSQNDRTVCAVSDPACKRELASGPAPTGVTQ